MIKWSSKNPKNGIYEYWRLQNLAHTKMFGFSNRNQVIRGKISPKGGRKPEKKSFFGPFLGSVMTNIEIIVI